MPKLSPQQTNQLVSSEPEAEPQPSSLEKDMLESFRRWRTGTTFRIALGSVFVILPAQAPGV